MLRLVNVNVKPLARKVPGEARFMAVNSTFNVVGFFRTPSKVYCQPGCMQTALTEFWKKKRVFVVTDKRLVDIGVSRKVTDLLDQYKYQYQIFSNIEADPVLANVMEGVNAMKEFKPDVIVAIGGGSPMDSAKVMRVLYENPKQSFASLARRCKNIRDGITEEDRMSPLASGTLADLVCIPTTSGTGSDVTPYAIITDETSETNEHHALADEALMPTMSIVDANLALEMPPTVTANSALFALAHSIEAYASPLGNDLTRALCLHSAKLIFTNLPRAYAEGKNAPDAREALHHAGTMSGMALANTSPGGVCHALAHRLCASFRMSPGTAHAALLPHCVAVEVKSSQTALRRYGELAAHLGFDAADDQARVTALIKGIEKLKGQVGVPAMLMDVVDPKTDHRDILELRMRNITTGAAADALLAAQAAGKMKAPSAAELRKMLVTAWDSPAA